MHHSRLLEFYVSKQSKKLCHLYWIHLPEHTDITSQGYIGITTTDVNKRFIAHKSAAKTSDHVIHRAIRKYKDKLCIKILVIGTLEYCLLLENRLRPDPHIGWNSAIGGLNGNPHTAESRQTMSIAQKAAWTDERRLVFSLSKRGKPISDATRQASKNYLKNRKPWEHHMANTDFWLKAESYYGLFLEDNLIGPNRLAKLIGVGKGQCRVLIKLFRSGWNPNNDPIWIQFTIQNNKEKEI